MVVFKFGESVKNMEDFLKAAASIFSLSPDNIMLGNPSVELPAEPPFIYVFALPDGSSENADPYIDTMRFFFFIQAGGDDTLMGSTIATVELCTAVRKHLSEFYPGIMADENAKPRPLALFSNRLLFTFELSTFYEV
jgi:hypothetical protein